MKDTVGLVSAQNSAPIAIVGMAFRFPGDLSDEASLWQALEEGRDVVSRLGNERWAVEELQHPKRSEAGRSITFSAGVLSRIDGFDAAFFGISPREAAWLDPQQRLLLELAWEAMENSGYPPSSLGGSQCAVYVGISGLDYGIRVLDDLSSMTPHFMTGNTLSMAANRLSYVFDLRGPSLAVDTACSSSMVALHHACNSLRLGEAQTALVGGVNLFLHPYPFIGFTKASMLSGKGRCRAFDASGDGYVRAEGGAMLLLKPLDMAIADGDDIQAVILATGTNADGSRKTGITIPSSEGQADVMRSVLRRSGISPHDVVYIEAHGTGTAVGDPIETAAIGAVYGSCRAAGQPLPIGSVKTNLGHLEPASGMAGLVKTVLALKNRAIPASLHLVTPNPNIDFAGLNLEVVTNYRRLEEPDHRPLVAGVNSTGFGGANAHVLLQEYRPRQDAARRAEQSAAPLFLSARTPQALRDMAGHYAKLLRQKTDSDLYDIAYSAAFRRERLEKRLAFRMANTEEGAQKLAAYAQGAAVEQIVIEDALAQPGGVAFIYSGNGSQWLGMGRRLLSESPRFAALVEALDARISEQARFSIIEELRADESRSRLDDTAVAQPLLFAIQVALTTMLREQGIEPAAVAGHSVGEVAAAWAAGALKLDDAIAVICARSAAQALTRGSGRMAAVGLSEAAAREVLAAENCNDIEIAAINSPSNVTLAGSQRELERLRTTLESRQVFFRLLPLDYAFHSRHMDPVAEHLARSLAGLAPSPSGAVTFVSTVRGEELDGATLDSQYWWHNVRRPVRFAQAVTALLARGCRVFVEIGPHAILQRYISECMSAEGTPGRVLPTLRRDADGLINVDDAILRVHMLCDYSRIEVMFPERGRHVRLPNYPWQRERHWHPKTSEGYALFERRRVHPLLGWRLKETEAGWENTLDLATLPWIADHKVGGAVVLPAAAYVEMALAAGRDWLADNRFELEDLDIVAPIVFDGEHGRSVRLELSTRDGSFQIKSRQRLSGDKWTINACGRLLTAAVTSEPERVSTEVPQDASMIDRQTHYRLAAAIGLDYGPAFSGLENVCVHGSTVQASLAATDAIEADQEAYVLHPALLDACFQSLVGFFRADIEAGQGVAHLPVKVGRLRLHRGGSIRALRARLVRRSARSLLAEFELLDADRSIVARLSDCRFRAAALPRHDELAAACWRLEPKLLPHPVEQQHGISLSTHDLAKRLRASFADHEARHERTAYLSEALPLFEALTISFAYAAFNKLFATHEKWLHQALNDPQAVGSSLRSFFGWLAGSLQEEGLLVQEGRVWRLEASDMPGAEEIWRTLLRDFPACLSELVVIGRVGRHLPALLTGEIDAGDFVQSLRSSPQFGTMHEDSPAYFSTRFAIEQVLRDLAEIWPANRCLRVMEIGGGASELPRRLAQLMSADRLEYVVVLDDEEARLDLEAEHQDDSFVTVAGIAGHDQGLSAKKPLPDAFDVVILRHWLHRSRDALAALALARRNLAGNGVLLLAERHPDLSADFVRGIDPHWWREGSVRKPISCLQPSRAWQNALAEQGFEDVETCLEPATENLQGGSYVILAKRPPAHPNAASQPALKAAWLLLADAHGRASVLASSLGKRLEAQGQRVAVAIAGEDALGAGSTFEVEDRSSIRCLLAAARRHLGRLDHVVHLAAADSSSLLDDGGDLSEWAGCAGLLDLVQGLTRSEARPPRVWVVTSGGAGSTDLADGLERDPRQTALWGFGRVVMNEHPELSCTLIDIATDCAYPETASRLENELLRPDGENEILLAPQGRYGLRMKRALPAAENAEQDEVKRFRLDFHMAGQLRNLAWLPQPERVLKDDEVEVRTVAAGLNFRDVMYVMGMVPDEAVENGFAGASLGLEFAGVITRIGQRVFDLAPGDAVMGFGSACFASHVVTKANAVARKPDHWSFEAAATVPTAFFTAYYALKHLADLQAGERVLIHGAAGGVGIAAAQLARHLGAEVFASAGSDEKRDFVRLLGADHVLDSRTLAYADEILALTGGEGVDVVLNSLAGEAVRRNLRALKPFGRFLELGKRDFFENTSIGLRPFKDNISYFAIDADQLLVTRSDLAARLFGEVMSLFRDGVLSPLPYRVLPAERVEDGFRIMQQARHIGKLVVKLDHAHVKVERPKAATLSVQFKKDATYLVTGGLSGFGLQTARWLAQHGAGNLLLLGRRGDCTPGATEAISELATIGAKVTVVACDVADAAALQSVLTEAKRELPPLKGIVHAAMVLDDSLIANLDVARLRRVLAPKVLGAWHLHTLTQDLQLDYFILYSSVTTFIGNPGQANYVAANAYLEGLTELRRSRGLAATCIAWGPIGDAGCLTRNEALKQSLTARLGAAPLTSERALAALERLLAAEGGTWAVADLDWLALARVLPSAQGARFAMLHRRPEDTAADAENSGDFQALIAGKSAAEVAQTVRSLVSREVAQILCISADRIDPARSLHELGMDSLMSVELALALEKRCGIALPSMLLNEGPTVDRVVERILNSILGAQDHKETDEDNGIEKLVRTVVAQHGELLSADDIAGTAASVQKRGEPVPAVS